MENQTTSGVVLNEWLFISPGIAGSSRLALRVGAATLLTMPLVAVAETDLVDLSLTQETGVKRNDKQKVWVLLEARDPECPAL